MASAKGSLLLKLRRASELRSGIWTRDYSIVALMNAETCDNTVVTIHESIVMMKQHRG